MFFILSQFQWNFYQKGPLFTVSYIMYSMAFSHPGPLQNRLIWAFFPRNSSVRLNKQTRLILVLKITWHKIVNCYSIMTWVTPSRDTLWLAGDEVPMSEFHYKLRRILLVRDFEWFTYLFIVGKWSYLDGSNVPSKRDVTPDLESLCSNKWKLLWALLFVSYRVKHYISSSFNLG